MMLMMIIYAYHHLCVFFLTAIAEGNISKYTLCIYYWLLVVIFCTFCTFWQFYYALYMLDVFLIRMFLISRAVLDM